MARGNKALAAPGACDVEILQGQNAKDEYSQYVENGRWLRQNWGRIQEKYAGLIVVIVDPQEGKVNAYEDAQDARAFIRSLATPNQAYVRYVPAANEALLL